jgi:hypothetical protein
MTHLGLPFIGFRAVVAGIEVVCRIDPCSCVDAMAPYAEMARRDMDHEISLRIMSDSRHFLRGDMDSEERMMKWFAWDHLPPHLREVSSKFSGLASIICIDCTPGPERTVALRKLLEAKDAAVRAKLHPGG